MLFFYVLPTGPVAIQTKIKWSETISDNMNLIKEDTDREIESEGSFVPSHESGIGENEKKR